MPKFTVYVSEKHLELWEEARKAALSRGIGVISYLLETPEAVDGTESRLGQLEERVQAVEANILALKAQQRLGGEYSKGEQG